MSGDPRLVADVTRERQDRGRVERRSCAASCLRGRRLIAELPHRDAELAGLIGQVSGDARPREYDDPDRQYGKNLIVALERRGLGVTGPVGLEHDLWDLAIIG